MHSWYISLSASEDCDKTSYKLEKAVLRSATSSEPFSSLFWDRLKLAGGGIAANGRTRFIGFINCFTPRRAKRDVDFKREL